MEAPQSSSRPVSALRGARFRRGARLLRRGDFERVYRGGRKHFSADLAAFWLQRPARGGGPRVGFTAGRALGGAVERNRIKRRLREAVRLELGRLALAVDVVLNPRKSALRADFQDLRRQVAAAFRAIEQDARRAKPGGEGGKSL